MVRIVLSVLLHLIGNKINVCYVIFTSKCEISFPITVKFSLCFCVSNLIFIIAFIFIDYFVDMHLLINLHYKKMLC